MFIFCNLVTQHVDWQKHSQENNHNHEVFLLISLISTFILETEFKKHILQTATGVWHVTCPSKQNKWISFKFQFSKTITITCEMQSKNISE